MDRNAEHYSGTRGASPAAQEGGRAGQAIRYEGPTQVRPSDQKLVERPATVSQLDTTMELNSRLNGSLNRLLNLRDRLIGPPASAIGDSSVNQCASPPPPQGIVNQIRDVTYLCHQTVSQLDEVIGQLESL